MTSSDICRVMKWVRSKFLIKNIVNKREKKATRGKPWHTYDDTNKISRLEAESEDMRMRIAFSTRAVHIISPE
jgi:hypothetical protein